MLSVLKIKSEYIWRQIYSGCFFTHTFFQLSKMRVLYKPLIAAAFGAAGSKFYYPRGATVSTAIGAFSLPLVLAAATGVSSLVSDTLHDYVFPAIHLNEKLGDQISATVSVGASAASVVGVSYLLQPDLISNIGVAKLASIGVLAEVASSYIYSNYLD